VRSRKEVFQRAIPLRLPIVEARSGDGLDGRRRIGLNPAEGDVGTAHTPRGLRPPPPTPGRMRAKTPPSEMFEPHGRRAQPPLPQPAPSFTSGGAPILPVAAPMGACGALALGCRWVLRPAVSAARRQSPVSVRSVFRLPQPGQPERRRPIDAQPAGAHMTPLVWAGGRYRRKRLPTVRGVCSLCPTPGAVCREQNGGAMRRFVALVLGTIAIGGGACGATAVAATSGAAVDRPVAAAANSCPAGFTHAVIGGAQKCLHAGEYCSHAEARQYRRYHFSCERIRGTYRLERS
jgi:hypothetical protein